MKPRYAHIDDRDIRAIADGLHSFKSKSEALAKLTKLANMYIISKENENLGDNELHLWIDGFEVTPEERNNSLIGNYGLIRVIEADDLFVLELEKDVRGSGHPHRKRKMRHHPDFGHPLLRLVRKGRAKYTTEIEAQEALKRMYMDYPNVCIPANNFLRLYLMIFSRAHEGSPVKKYILNTEVIDGSFVIMLSENKHNTMQHLRKIDEFYDEPHVWHSND